ncbi:MAG: YciI family protein [Actinobacteria bacterium]|nr:YciI family protein [Actinomycetota bacterium]
MMPKFMLLYRGGAATDPGEMTEEQVAGEMAKWMAWGEKVGPALTDFGNPFGAGASAVGDGSAGTPTPLSGYSIVEAADLSAAVGLVEGHPYLGDGSGNFAVDVFEVMPAPGM